MATALVFPGQGSQAVGMGRALCEAFAPARLVFEEVDAALGVNLTRLIFEGPDAELMLTDNAQPALMSVSMAAMRTLEAEAGFEVARDARFVAGHSLGEYSALAAARALSVADAARLLRLRGEAMQMAAPVGSGAMAAVLGLELEAVADVVRRAAAETGEVCEVANDNGGGQVVVSGSKAAVARAAELAKERGAKRAVALPVSAPFHCSLMKPAAEAMAEALACVVVHKPVPPLVANVLARPVDDPTEIRQRLVEQVTGAVRWAESVTFMTENGVDCFFELGAGKVLTGLARRIAPSAKGFAFGAPDDLAALPRP
jgi:[acyl-carrier-protein] S-malonyltransferase